MTEELEQKSRKDTIVIFLSEYYYTTRDVHRFGAEYLDRKGYRVEMWTVFPKNSLNSAVHYSFGEYKGDNMK